tara:strand:+ start:1096 stop:1728 length:633 start_codon:yes stop_codon:yes gene_type:complete
METLAHKMEIRHCFTSPLVLIRNREFIPELKKYIYKQKTKGIESDVAKHLKINLVESKFDFLSHDNNSVTKIKNFLGESLANLVNTLHQEKCIYRINFNESWFHIGKTNSTHEVHFHGNCSWCGIYFVQSGDKGSGKTVFCNPAGINYLDWGSRYLNQQMDIGIEPEDGLLVLFPSHLRHYQALYTGKEDRIVVAFNASVYQEDNGNLET